MADWIKAGTTLLNSLRSQYNTIAGGVSVTRGVVTATAVPARSCNPADETDDRYGGAVRQDSRDFIITASDYVISGTAVKPKRGDVITEPDGNTWEVASDGGLSSWSWHDASSTCYRIRTKIVKLVV